MEETNDVITILEYFRMTSAGLSLPAIITLTFILWKNGIISFSGKANGNGNYQPQIDDLKSDVVDIKGEVKEMREELSEVAGDVSYIRGRLSK